MFLNKAFHFKYCIDNDGVLVEITTEDKQEKVESFLKENDDISEDTLWIALRKYECWVWTSDTPMCNPKWESEPNEESGGQ